MLLSGCDNPGNVAGQNTPSNYFDVEQLVLNASNNLQLHNKPILKVSEVNHIIDTQTITNQQAVEELSIIKELSLNKKSWQGLFKMQTKDSADQQITLHTSADKKIPVKQLKIYQNYLNGHLMIDGVIEKNNAIYSMQKHIKAEFVKNRYGYNLTRAYLQGHQKILLVDSLLFKVEYLPQHD